MWRSVRRKPRSCRTSASPQWLFTRVTRTWAWPSDPSCVPLATRRPASSVPKQSVSEESVKCVSHPFTHFLLHMSLFPQFEGYSAASASSRLKTFNFSAISSSHTCSVSLKCSGAFSAFKNHRKGNHQGRIFMRALCPPSLALCPSEESMPWGHSDLDASSVLPQVFSLCSPLPLSYKYVFRHSCML